MATGAWATLTPCPGVSLRSLTWMCRTLCLLAGTPPTTTSHRQACQLTHTHTRTSTHNRASEAAQQFVLAVLPGDVLSAGADERDRHLRHVQPDAATLQHDFSLQLATRLAPAAAALRVRRFGNAAGGNDDLTGIGLDSWDSGAGGGEGSEAGSPGAHAPPSPPKPGQLLAPPLVPAQWVGCAGSKGVVLHHTARITPFCCHVCVCVCACSSGWVDRRTDARRPHHAQPARQLEADSAWRQQRRCSCCTATIADSSTTGGCSC